jgi:hypothetical protein
MPQVRIITRPSEYPTELVKDLRARGYEVETHVSGAAITESADLEITLDHCALENANELLSKALLSKDVVIFADSQGKGRKIQSIGMVLLNSEGAESPRKMAVPESLNEIYTALLRGRAESRKISAANWISIREKMSRASNQRLRTAWSHCHAIGKNLSQFSSQTFSEAIIWAESRKWFKKSQPQAEPDLVPSMFNLSGAERDPSEAPSQIQEEMRPISEQKWAIGTFRFWKPVAAGLVAILAITLFLHGFTHSRPNSSNVVDTQSPSMVPAAVLAKDGKDDAAPKVLAKSHANNGDDYFQEVVVRHFRQSAPAKALPKDGVKRRVVVD